MNQRAFTLIELVIYILVFSIGITSIMLMMPQILSKNSDSTMRLRGVQVAQAAMEEILAKKWDETTPNGGGLASAHSALGSDTGEPLITTDPPDFRKYDDVDDYDGLTNSESNELDGFNLTEGYTVNVAVKYVVFNGNTYKEIQVTVHSSTLDEDYELYALKGDF